MNARQRKKLAARGGCRRYATWKAKPLVAKLGYFLGVVYDAAWAERMAAAPNPLLALLPR